MLILFLATCCLIAAFAIWMADDSSSKFIDYTAIDDALARRQRINRGELLPEWLNVRRSK